MSGDSASSMVRGKSSAPLFSVGDSVTFSTKWGEVAGTVEIVDYRGRERTAFKGCDWSYDIFVKESPARGGESCLHKHVPECDVSALVDDVLHGDEQ